MEQEIELKFDIPLDMKQEDVLRAALEVISEQGLGMVMKSPEKRTFQYFDTHDLTLYRTGQTARCIGGFNDGKPGRLRYDFKLGPLEHRFEESYWCEDNTISALVFNVFNMYLPDTISETAYAETEHEKIDITKGPSVIELTIDSFDVREGGRFRELELELKRGNPKDLEHIAAEVNAKLGLEPVTKQKYARALESMPAYQEKIARIRG